MKSGRIGVVLLNMGGPDSLEDVPPYLLNIFRDPHILDMPFGALVRPWLSRIIVKKRAAASADRYRLIGGKTPLNGITAAQAGVIKDALARRGVDATAAPGMRYWHPFTTDTLARFAREGVDAVAGLSMYPAYSSATSGSSLEEFDRAAKLLLPGVPAYRIGQWPALPAYVEFLRRGVTDALEAVGREHWRETAVLFTAHSVPMRLIRRGDPYRSHIEQTMKLVNAGLPEGVRTALGWQSAVGPAKWLEPDSKAVAAVLRSEGFSRLVVAPLGFVAENIETLWDIEIDLRAHAVELGFNTFLRVACPNDDAAVMDGLAGLVADAVKGETHGG